MRLIADISRCPDGRIEGTILCGDRDAPMPFSGVLDLLRILEDEIPAEPAAPGRDHGSGGARRP
jgi:hypothetical protein